MHQGGGCKAKLRSIYQPPNQRHFYQVNRTVKGTSRPSIATVVSKPRKSHPSLL